MTFQQDAHAASSAKGNISIRRVTNSRRGMAGSAAIFGCVGAIILFGDRLSSDGFVA